MGEALCPAAARSLTDAMAVTNADATETSDASRGTILLMRAGTNPVIRATRCVLKDGTPAIVRPVHPDDARHAEDFFNWLSDETRYLRFMYQAKELTPEILRGALAQDGLKRVSLVVEPVTQAGGDPPAIALGRYAPTEQPDTCEVAITVGDRWQGRGAGRALVARLIALARRGGYRTMCATALSTNAKMVGLARSFAFEIREEAGGVTTMRRAL